MQKILQERYQGPETRQNLYKSIQELTDGVPIIAFFTSFRYPVMMTDGDADMIEALLQKCDLSNGFYLLLSSPGGDGLSAERIIKICRNYSETNNYSVIVPGKAKSAATMVCLGASEILMSNTSELGPVDPQVVIEENGELKRFSIYNIIKSYKKVFSNAEKSTGNLEPYIQQLNYYDSRQIQEFISMCSLSEDIVIKALKSGMLSTLSEDEIKEKIEMFINPKHVKVHGRPIFYDDMEDCGLNIKLEDPKGELWKNIYELYYRLNYSVSNNNTAKIIENEEQHFEVRM